MTTSRKENRNLNKPLQKTSIINKGAPLTQVPIHVLQCIDTETRLPAQKNNNTLCLGRYETKKENIPATTIVTFKDRFSQGTIFMKANFLVLSSNLQDYLDYLGVYNLAKNDKNKFQ